MVARITYMGCVDAPPVHAFKHPISGDMLGFNIGRPLLLDPSKAANPDDAAFYQSVIDAVTADPEHYRVEDVAEGDLPFPVGAVYTAGWTPGMGHAPEYVPPEAPIADAEAAPASERRSRGDLEAMTKDELVDYATGQGIDVRPSDNKSDIIDAIVKAQRRSGRA